MSWPHLEVVRVVTVFDATENRRKECEGLGKITERKRFRKSIPDMYQDHLRWSEALMYWRKESLDNDCFQRDRFDAQLLALDKCVTGRLEAAWRRTDRHRNELERLKGSVQGLEGGILELESEKVAR